MSIREKTTYMAQCDYPGCHMSYDFWGRSKENAIRDVIDDEEWLCLFTGDNEPRFFCPLHLRYVRWRVIFFGSDNPATQPTLHALNKYYEDMSTPQPLPKLECEDTILDILQNEKTRRKTMATNVTEKDKTLNEIMAWCDQLSMEIKCTEDATTDRTYGKLRGLYLVYEHCQNMLGHSGSMPSEVPNQSEDAK